MRGLSVRSNALSTERSDVDILIERTEPKAHGMFEVGGLYEAYIAKEVGLVTTQTLERTSACSGRRCLFRTTDGKDTSDITRGDW